MEIEDSYILELNLQRRQTRCKSKREVKKLLVGLVRRFKNLEMMENFLTIPTSSQTLRV